MKKQNTTQQNDAEQRQEPITKYKAENSDIARQSHYAESSEDCESGQDQAVENIERALYDLASGYSRDVTKVMWRRGEPTIVKYQEHVPPDLRAIIFWVINRRGGRWSTKPVARIDDDDPFGRFLKSLNGKVLRPVDPPDKCEPEK